MIKVHALGKAVAIAATLFSGNPAFGQEYRFQVHRLCHLGLVTTKEKESKKINIFPKTVPETEMLLMAGLKQMGEDLFVTDGGRVQHLGEIAERNRLR